MKEASLSSTAFEGRRVFFGFLIVVGIAFAWVGSTQLASSGFSASFNGVFFSVWFSTGWLGLSFLTLVFGSCRRGGIHMNDLFALIDKGVDAHLPFLRKKRKGEHASEYGVIIQRNETPIRTENVVENEHHQGEMDDCDPLLADALTVGPSNCSIPNDCKDGRMGLESWRTSLKWWEVLAYVLPFLLLWTLANYLYVKALTYMSATDVTAVFSATPTFVYILSMWLLGERASVLRVLAVIFTVGGVVSISVGENVDHVTYTGVLLTLGASISAAVYKVLFKVMMGDASVNEVSGILTILSFLDIVLLWPIWIVLQCTHTTESFSWDNVPWAFMCGSAVTAVAFNFLINFGVAYAFPLLISIGTVLGIPLNATVDVVFRGDKLGVLEIVGCVLVVVGFILMLVPVRGTPSSNISIIEEYDGCFQSNEDHLLSQPTLSTSKESTPLILAQH
eukprot:m.138852 g.138852  ORF g.138852 m.138852 type:complete len:449 (-) comp17326_c0_seq1:220-1566(-)